MAIMNNYYRGYVLESTGTTTATRLAGDYGIDPYWHNQLLINDSIITSKPLVAKQKTFEDELQSEINQWLSEFD